MTNCNSVLIAGNVNPFLVVYDSNDSSGDDGHCNDDGDRI